MCDRPEISLKAYHSCCETQSRKSSENTRSSCKSDVNITPSNKYPTHSNSEEITTSENSGCGEYYKRYEHDAAPVKDIVSSNITSTDSGKGDRVPLTESCLVKIEKNVFGQMSQEPRNSFSYKSLDSNVKFFKSTVEQIFDKFYSNMHDIELYKKRYQNILHKKREDSVEEMEDFIKDMIHHIMSSDSSVFDQSHLCEVADKCTTVSTDAETSTHGSLLRNLHCVIEAFKNDNYFTDSTNDDKGCISKQDFKNKNSNNEILSIHVSPENPVVKIKMSNRKLFSEININDSRISYKSNNQVASAEDFKKINEKKIQLETYEKQNIDIAPRLSVDKDIPVKLSFAKKNIHLNEDFDNESIQKEKSFISRVCNYLCKRLRRTSIA